MNWEKFGNWLNQPAFIWYDDDNNSNEVERLKEENKKLKMMLINKRANVIDVNERKLIK